MQQSLVWGMRNYDSVAFERADYKADDHTVESRAARYATVGGGLILMFCFMIGSGIAIIQATRKIMMHHPNQNFITITVQEFGATRDQAKKFGAQMGAIMITAQIKTLDFIWSKLSVFITDRENHKTDARYQASLVFKTVIVKFFNAMYPFIYIAFAKQYVEGCKSEKYGCIPELQIYIMTFFVTDICTTFATIVVGIVKTKKFVRDEMNKPGVDAASYTYLQVQAKFEPFQSKDMINDYMSLTVQFGIVTCFSVVLPSLTMLALLTNLIKYRLIAYRQLCVMQRVYPTGSEGIGAWLDIFRGVCQLAMMCNAGLAIFGIIFQLGHWCQLLYNRWLI